MDETRKKKRRRIIVWIIILCAAAALVGGLILRNRQKKDAEKNQYTTEELKKRTIVNSVSGSGTVVSQSSEEVSSDMTGATILSVDVSQGDTVSAGQTIATMDTSSIDSQIQSLNQQIQSLENQKKQAEDAAKQAEESAKAQQASADQAAAETAARNQEAQASLSAAVEAQSARVAEEQEKLDGMNQTYQSKYAADPTSEDAVRYQALILQEQQVVNSEQAELQTMQQSLAALQSGQDVSSIDLSSLPGSSGTDSLTTFDGTIKTLKDQVSSLNEEKKKAVVTTKNGGTVTAVNAKAGDRNFGTAIAVVENVNAMEITAEVDEYDIPDVKTGMAVKIQTDATRDKELDGTVTDVAIKATDNGSSSLGALSGLTGSLSQSLGSLSSSSGATYTVKIALNEQNDRLRLGMNARISIITNSAEDVWSVPIESVRTKKNGEKYIEVLSDDGKKSKNSGKKRIPVTTGLEGTYYVEIKGSGLKKGLDVIVPETEKTNSVDELMNMMGSDAGI